MEVIQLNDSDEEEEENEDENSQDESGESEDSTDDDSGSGKEKDDRDVVTIEVTPKEVLKNFHFMRGKIRNESGKLVLAIEFALTLVE